MKDLFFLKAYQNPYIKLKPNNKKFTQRRRQQQLVILMKQKRRKRETCNTPSSKGTADVLSLILY